ncbi:hypothetical protein BMS3Abin17_00754 [archaeon BMS3Abin17]|nr:hypothetical protein BMS3Abin17_00754 [archaeon BMS3Abin17]HDZ60873.1 PGF-pre-PGF domain-containing protein [Candidatus Pacearchaeota archaeon]
MVEKRGYYVQILFLILFVTLLIPSIEASFVCGIVKNSLETSASWINVIVYYSDVQEKQTTCDVSPDENKYCCDTEDIAGVSWAIGKQVSAKIFDINKGYVAEPVNLYLSGEGYDVFPEMQLEKAIRVYSPEDGSIISDSRVFVNVSFSSMFTKLKYILNYANNTLEEDICSDCSNAEFYIKNLSTGSYELLLTVSGVDGNVTESVFFTIPSLITFNREIKCRGCVENYIPAGRKVVMQINLESSDNLSGTFIDYFPVDWRVLRHGGGITESFSKTHNLIKWEVQGKEIIKEYTLKSPRKFFTRKYIFQSVFENIEGPKDEVILFRFYKFLSLLKKFTHNPMKKANKLEYLEISPSKPLVMFFRNKNILEIDIFPKNKTKGIYMYLQKNHKPKLRKAESNFVIHTNLLDENIEKILIKFKVKKPSRRKILKDVSLFYYNEAEETWNSLGVEQYGEDDRYAYFLANSENKGIFAIKKKYGRIK